MIKKLGILAYGSLIDDPGEEIGPIIIDRVNCATPFTVEYFRKSKKRDFGPTLIPVGEGGSYVNAVILILRDNVSLTDAENMLWRRETGKNDRNIPYERKANPGIDSVLIEYLPDFYEVNTVIYTAIQANIPDNSPEVLARLAINSILSDAGERAEDGIRYLRNAINNGIQTPMTTGYVEAILALTNSDSLDNAIIKLDAERALKITK